MKIVLLENIKNFGEKGEIKEVGDGYALNFLIPNKKAIEYSTSIGKNLVEQKQKQKENNEQSKKDEVIEINKLPEEIFINFKATKNKALFYGFNKKTLIEYLKNKNYFVLEKWFDFKNIKEFGKYEILAKTDGHQKIIKVIIKEEQIS